jgi:hypothetical protein
MKINKLNNKLDETNIFGESEVNTLKKNYSLTLIGVPLPGLHKLDPPST